MRAGRWVVSDGRMWRACGVREAIPVGGGGDLICVLWLWPDSAIQPDTIVPPTYTQHILTFIVFTKQFFLFGEGNLLV